MSDEECPRCGSYGNGCDECTPADALESALARIAELEEMWVEHTGKLYVRGEFLEDNLSNAHIRIAELEAALNAPNRHGYKVGVAVGKAAARAEALDEAEKVVGAVEVPKGGWPKDRPGVWCLALNIAMDTIRALKEPTDG